MLRSLKKKNSKSPAVTETSDLEQVSAITFPRSQVPQKPVEPRIQTTYEEIARRLGFLPTELVRDQLLAFFAEEEIALYNYSQVVEWLSEKKKDISVGTWCWRPLRGKDIINNFHWGTRSWTGKVWRWTDGYYHAEHGFCRPYERLVPMHALEKVTKIEEKFGEQVKFFVSDFAVDYACVPNAKGDPFVMVRPAMSDSGTPGEYQLIFDAWDEPGFGA